MILNQGYYLKSARKRSSTRWDIDQSQAQLYPLGGLVVQVNGKLRDRILVAPGISDAEAQEKALASEAVQQALDGKPVRKVIIVPGRLVNVVV